MKDEVMRDFYKETEFYENDASSLYCVINTKRKKRKRRNKPGATWEAESWPRKPREQ